MIGRLILELPREDGRTSKHKNNERMMGKVHFVGGLETMRGNER